jgi:alginate O-acetyltransferase complex protein AlgI
VLFASALGSVPWAPWLRARLEVPAADGARPGLRGHALAWARVAACLAVLLLCAMKLAAGTHNPFIYFRF